MINFRISSDKLKNNIFIPKYYDPNIAQELEVLEKTHNCYSVGNLISKGVISLKTGDEIGKSAYGTGDIPFVRTSDISNWEIKAIPKQGISKDIYDGYAKKQDVCAGDILLVRDGTYLIGTNCFITAIDSEILYQSHILKIRNNKPEVISPEILFLSLNSPIVQNQIRSIQFTADIIDTIGQRFDEVIIPVPKSRLQLQNLTNRAQTALRKRVVNKAFINHAPVLLEDVLTKNTTETIESFLELSLDELADEVSHRTVTSEFGSFESFYLNSSKIRNQIYLPKYYDPNIELKLKELQRNCQIIPIGKLRDQGKLQYYTGDEIGKMAYGTGEIPFIRTSDFSNWEIKHDPKQGVSQDIYDQYAEKQNVRENDIFLVRDGTYLIGTSCIVTSYDEKCLFCGGLIKMRVVDNELLDPFLLLGLMNSFIVKRQIRNKQFTRDVIDTIGNRLDEVFLPIPKEKNIRDTISQAIRSVVSDRINARLEITTLSKEINYIHDME